MYNLKKFLETKAVIGLDDVVHNTTGDFQRSDGSIGARLEGNCLWNINGKLHDGKNGSFDKEPLRKNLYNLAKKSSSVLEIGFNAGHSAALFLHANSEIKLLCFDLCSHRYTKDCVSYLNSLYPFEFIEGDSRSSVKNYPKDSKYDLIHIDGGHGGDVLKADTLNCSQLAHENTIVIIDDAYWDEIPSVIEEFLDSNILKEVDYNALDLEVTKFHRMFNYI